MICTAYHDGTLARVEHDDLECPLCEAIKARDILAAGVRSLGERAGGAFPEEALDWIWSAGVESREERIAERRRCPSMRAAE